MFTQGDIDKVADFFGVPEYWDPTGTDLVWLEDLAEAAVRAGILVSGTAVWRLSSGGFLVTVNVTSKVRLASQEMSAPHLLPKRGVTGRDLVLHFLVRVTKEVDAMINEYQKAGGRMA